MLRMLVSTVSAWIISLAALLTGCSDTPPSWQKLLAAKIGEQYPQYQVSLQADGGLLVKRPGQADAPVDVDDIAHFCRRGPKDCSYATDKMLLELRGGK